MSIFKIHDSKLDLIKEMPIALEKDIQKLTEKNLDVIFGLEFIASELTLPGQEFRIDTLAFDQETKSFVIIEYKKGKSYSVIDQGVTYLESMREHKAAFVLEYNEKKEANLTRDNIDWSQSRVLFLAGSFTPYQRKASGFKSLPIELWEVKKYDNQMVLYNHLKPTSTKESMPTVSAKDTTIANVSQEMKAYTIDDHFKPGWEDAKELFEEMREEILALDSRMEEKVNKFSIGYMINNARVVALFPHKSKLRLELLRVEKKDLHDPDNKVADLPWQQNKWSKMCKCDNIVSSDDIGYARSLIKQIVQKEFSK